MKEVSLIEMPFITEGGDKHLCNVCNGCNICGKGIPHHIGYLIYLGMLFD